MAFMNKTLRMAAALSASAALLSAPIVFAQDTKSKAPAPAAKADAAKGKELYPQGFYDFMIKQRLSQGQPDSPELRAAVRDELNTRELLVREAKKQGVDKNPTVKTEIDLAGQTVIVRTYMAEYLKSHPVSDAALHKEYDTIKSQIGDKEYKVRHILVENEAEAKEVIAALQKGEKFEKLAERSKDTGSKVNGGDLDWNAPANFVKPFSDAMTALPKGKFTTTPVQTQFGWHVIEVTDIREAKVPPFDDVKTQLAQRMQGQVVDAYLKELRAKNGL
jgi:peptidyl-prolyl cis-trans isomerase C